VALELAYSRRAIKDLAGLPPTDRERATRRLNAYAETPDAQHHA